MKAHIDYDARKGRFIIQVPPWLNDTVRAIPSRKWNDSGKVWTAPATRVNVKYMSEAMGGAHWTRSALAKLAEVKDNTGKVIAPALPWPLHYKFKTEPMRTQRAALERAFGRPAFAFFKDMGTGKSKTFIDLASASRMHPLVDAALMVCPVALRKNWLRELAIHCPLPYDAYILNSAKPKEFDAWLDKKHDFKWLIVGVESLGISAKPYEMMLKFLDRMNKRVIMGIDESSKIKNHASIRSQRCHFAARHAAIRIPMTGTPIAKSVMDLYSQFEFMDPDILGIGDFYAFRNRYAVFGGFENKQMIGYQNMDELMEIITPFIYQVRKEEAMPDLPPKVYTRRYVKMSVEQSKHYKSMVKDRRITLTGVNGESIDHTVKNVLGMTLRLQQIAGGFLPVEVIDPLTQEPRIEMQPIGKGNPKVEDLLDWTDEFDGQAIIWCAYRPEIDAVVTALRAKFGADQVVECHGGIEESKRDIDINEVFQSGRARWVVGNVSTGGMGLTMTAATAEFYYSNTHNFIDRAQSEDRAHRKGQKNSVLYVDQIAQIDMGTAEPVDTIDAAIVASNEGKKDLSEYVKDEIERITAEGGRDLSSLFGC
ncbi:MAG: DEAD/DEAH box helicase [Nevskiaceae bacterium]|nr:MAG: DEAD/DEAH box helicase [Nevskiaceae bacterium]